MMDPGIDQEDVQGSIPDDLVGEVDAVVDRIVRLVKLQRRILTRPGRLPQPRPSPSVRLKAVDLSDATHASTTD